MCETTIGIPVRAGNRVEFLTSSEQGLVRLIKDIDEARQTCHLEFYIWAEGGLADEVGKAVLRAAKRGVICRILLDDVGSREFLRSDWAERFREGGVAMPVRPFKGPHLAAAVRAVRFAFASQDCRDRWLDRIHGKHEPGRFAVFQAVGRRGQMDRCRCPHGRSGCATDGHYLPG